MRHYSLGRLAIRFQSPREDRHGYLVSVFIGKRLFYVELDSDGDLVWLYSSRATDELAKVAVWETGKIFKLATRSNLVSRWVTDYGPVTLWERCIVGVCLWRDGVACTPWPVGQTNPMLWMGD